MWEVIFMLLVLKIPIVYVCWVVWWAIKAEPVVGSEGEQAGIDWQPWRRRRVGPRPRRSGPHGMPGREGARGARRRRRTPA